MRAAARHSLQNAALLLACAAVVIAHGDEDAAAAPATNPGMGMNMAGSMDMGGHNDASTSSSVTVSGKQMLPGYSEHDQGLYDMPSYWGHPEHRGLIYAHIILMLLAWLIVLPTGEMRPPASRLRPPH